MPYTEQVTTFDCLYPYKCTITGMKFYSFLMKIFFVLITSYDGNVDHITFNKSLHYTRVKYIYISYTGYKS